jgi:hypothetical protein
MPEPLPRGEAALRLKIRLLLAVVAAGALLFALRALFA